MNQLERRRYLIERLLEEQKGYWKEDKTMQIPAGKEEQKTLLRSLMNVRMPSAIDEEFLHIQDAYLQQVNAEKGIVTLSEMEELEQELYLYKGDITRLKVGAIVNAANSGMTGCYQPCHNCIDNCIHTYAGVQLRLECAKLMQRQGHEELLSSCYQSCLEAADEKNLESIAFCCISTGVFMFPNERAAEIAVETVKAYKKRTGSRIKVVFNVFKDYDEAFYRNLL